MHNSTAMQKQAPNPPSSQNYNTAYTLVTLSAVLLTYLLVDEWLWQAFYKEESYSKEKIQASRTPRLRFAKPHA